MTGLSRRPVSPADAGVLRSIFAASRPHLALAPLDDAGRDLLLDLQLAAQARDFASRWPDQQHEIVLMDGEPVGRVWLGLEPDLVHLLDLALLPAYRGRGIGSRLVQEVLDDAARTGRSVVLHVARGNPAQRLYERAGFTVSDSSDTHREMRWRPS